MFGLLQQSKEVKRKISRPKSVTWRESHGEQTLAEEASNSEELWETETDIKVSRCI